MEGAAVVRVRGEQAPFRHDPVLVHLFEDKTAGRDDFLSRCETGMPERRLGHDYKVVAFSANHDLPAIESVGGPWLSYKHVVVLIDRNHSGTRDHGASQFGSNLEQHVARTFPP